MPEEQRETREQEVARIRSYLASQAMRRTPTQIVDAVREAHRQFLEATTAIPDADFRMPPREGEWAAAHVLQHVCTMAVFDERAIRGVIERGEQPPDIRDVIDPTLQGRTREDLLAALESARQELITAVLQADPEAHLNIMWGHNEFGKMNWREWLLFARVHTLDHARQMQAIASGQ